MDHKNRRTGSDDHRVGRGRGVTRVAGRAGRFPNEAFLLRPVSALLAETSKEWEPGIFTSTRKPPPSPQFKCPANLQN
jgi:hypothetical protein